MNPTTYEEKLLPVLVEELSLRHSAPRDVRPLRRVRGRILVPALLAAAALTVLLALTTGGTSDGVVNLTVVSGAMSPTLEPGQVVAVDTNAYSSALPRRGDVIAFRMSTDPRTIAIMRVIGLPGDTVEESDGVVSVNGQLLDEPYVSADHMSGSWLVEAGRVFVMGDNRAIAYDSRYETGVGQVPLSDVFGKVLRPTSGAPDIPAGPPGSAGPS